MPDMIPNLIQPPQKGIKFATFNLRRGGSIWPRPDAPAKTGWNYAVKMVFLSEPEP
jgi:hypothetical protein